MTEFWIHGAYVQGPPIQNLEPGATREIEKNWVFKKAQPHNIRVYVDATTKIVESNEENNWADTTVIVVLDKKSPLEETSEEEAVPSEEPGLKKRLKERIRSRPLR